MKNVNTINGIQSPQFYQKKLTSFLKQNLKQTFNSICLPPFHNRKISEYHETILKEAFDGKISET